MSIRPIDIASPLTAISFFFAVNHTGGHQTAPMYVALTLLVISIAAGAATTLVFRSAPLFSRSADATIENIEQISSIPTRYLIALPISISTICLALLVSWLLCTNGISELAGTSHTIAWIIGAVPLAYLLSVLTLKGIAEWVMAHALIMAAAAVVFCFGIVDFLVTRSRPFSVFEDVNVLAAFCNAFALPAIARLHQKTLDNGVRRAWTSFSAAFLLVALACLAATASRGGHLSFLFGTAAMGTLLIRRDSNAWKSVLASMLLFISLLAAIAPLQRDAGSLSRLASMDSDQSTSDRIEMLKSTWRMVEDGPWYGSGLGTYKIRYLMYRSPNERSTTGDLAHNDYLQMLAEGGPVLLGILLVLALGVGLSAVRLWRTARSTDDSPRFIESAGLVGALFCLFGHAALNFIFYVLPLAMITGLYLGRLDNLRTDVAHVDVSRYVSRPMLLTLLGGLMVWLTATLGLQSAYYAMTTGKCELRMCRSLSGDEKFFGKFSALLAATQPSYLPARGWFVNAYTASANSAKDDAKRIDSAQRAAKELSDQIHEFPALPYVYRDLASLIIKHPEAAAAITSGISHDPTVLLTESVRRNPLDTSARTLLAQRLRYDGQLDAAFTLLFVDGMRWWKVAALSDSGRMALLKAAIPIAIETGRCTEAAEMAEGLSAFSPDDPLSKPPTSCAVAPETATPRQQPDDDLQE